MRLADQFALRVAPPVREPIYEWASKHFELHGLSIKGKFKGDNSRHLLPIFDGWQDDHTREVNILKPVRGAGSVVGDVICGWALKNAPGPYLEVFQSKPEADKYNETRSVPNIKNNPVIAELLRGVPRHKICDNEILFANGYPWYGLGPAIGNLQAKSIRHLRLEEVWMWDQGTMAEAEARVGDYLRMETSKILRISQGGPKDNVPMEESDWFVTYHRGQIHEWEVQCLLCGKYFDPVFGGMRPDGTFYGLTWDRIVLPGGDWDVAKCLPTVRFECPHCAAPMLDTKRTKSEWNRTGRYRAIGEANRRRKSFHWEAVIDYPWIDLLELWLSACNQEKRGNLAPKIQFYQKRRAMFKDEESLLKGGLNLARTAYEINSDWPEEVGRCLIFDRQEEDLLWWTVRAWSLNETRRIAFGKCYGFAALEELRIKNKVEPNHTMGDSAYLPKGDHGVYAACMKYGWIALRGDKAYSFVHHLKNKRTVLRSYAALTWGDPESGTGRKRGCPLIRFSKPQMNQKVQELIDNGRWKEPIVGEDAELEKEYNLQMASRVKKTEFVLKTGETRTYFKESQNDHARDLANGAVLFAILREFLPDPASEALTKTEQKEAENAAQ